MPLRPVVAFPDPVLARRCEPVGEVDAAARALADDLLAVMRSVPHCVGLAANQLGVPLRAFCLDVRDHPKTRSCHGEVVLFDPVISESTGAVVAREGCMSVPDLTGDVARATALVVTGLGFDGELRRLEVDAFEARAVQHEVDHLDGHLFLDRVVADDRVFRRRLYR